MLPYVHCSVICNSQDMEATQCPLTGDWINMWHISHNKEWNITICNNMDGPGGCYAKWNGSDRERQMPYDFTYMWSLKKERSEQT